MRTKFITSFMLALICGLPLSAKVYTITSPNKKLVVNISVNKELKWDIKSGNSIVMLPSSIALQTDKACLGKNMKVSKASIYNKVENVDKADVWGIKANRPYQGLKLSGNGYDVEFRVFNDAASYRFVPKKLINRVINETSEYLFAGNPQTFVPYVNDNRGGERWCYSFESYYDEAPLSNMYQDSLAITPLAVCLPQGKKAVVMEADVENYPGMYLLKKNTEGKSANDAENAGGLQAAFPPASWIKSGKVAWDWWNNTNITGVDFRAGINTDTYKYFVDFAKNNHLEYIIIDEGWSDPEDLLIFSDKMDMAGIINYAKENGVGVILWSSWRNLVQRGHEKMEEIMKHYGDMGVKGFKVDFFDRDDQKAINSVYEIAECAAKHHLLLDLHGMRPFGVQCAYPNIINFEGVKGLENSKWEPRTADGPLHDQPRYDVTIPYLRALPGAFDYTPGAMVNAVRSQFFGNNDHPMSQGTRVHQMAMYTLFDAPLQMLADSPTKYMQNQECTDFIAQIPTVYDEVIPLCGKLGEYVAVAKRKGNKWYIAAMNNWQERDIMIDLSLIKSAGDLGFDQIPGFKGKANVFADGINADREATDYKHTYQQISSADKLQIHLAPAGGWTAIIE